MASHPIQYQRTDVHIRIYTPPRRHKIERNNRGPTGRGPLGAESRGRRGPAPSVRTPTEQAGFQESLQGPRRGQRGGSCALRASSRSSAHPLPAERRPVLHSTALAPTVGAQDGSGGSSARPPASPLSRPQPSPPFASQARGRWQDGRGNHRPSPASSLAPSRPHLCPSEGQDRSPCSARGPRGPDPRSPPPPSGSSLRRPPGLCGCPGGCPGSLQLACRLFRPQGSHLGLRARRPGAGGPPPASPGSG